MKWKTLLCVAMASVLSVGVIREVFIIHAATISTSVVTTASAPFLTQANYEWYANIDALTPSPELAAENTGIATPASGGQLRLRMNIGNAELAFASGATFKLQYANTTAGPWTDLSTSTAWIFFDNPSVADGQVIVTTVLPSSTVGESYGESNPSASSPNALQIGDFGEWDWVITNNDAATASNWFFRMVYASGTAVDSYASYPELTAVAASSGGGGSSGGSIGVAAGGGGSAAGSGTVSGTTTTPSGTPSSSPILQPTLPTGFECVDLNHDNRVDIIDLSILLYYYGRLPPSGWCSFLENGVVDFKDVSILMYYWTN